MVKRSNAGLILAIIATVLTLITYFAFSAVLASPEFGAIIEELYDEAPDETVDMLVMAMESIESMLLIFGIANLAFGILGWRIKFFNGFLTLLGWLYLLCGGFIFFLIQGILTLIASSKNKKYWVEMDLLKKLEREKELRDAVNAKSE